jgi:nitrile hydratase subunit beta
MNGAHDLGGQMGFGPVLPEADEPVFHADWERRALGLTLAMGALGQWNIDQSRSARESIHPARYLALSYYEIWLEGLRRLMLARMLVGSEEWPEGQLPVAHDSGSVTGLSALPAVAVDPMLKRGSPTLRQSKEAPGLVVGQKVQTLLIHPQGHTRLPRYARGKRGVVVSNHGYHVFADANAQGRHEAHWLYTVCFPARELWGPDTTADEVNVDCWEPYLLPVGD